MFCWTRFGTEAGETVSEILARKERERHATGGIFFWGIGNSVAPAIASLLHRSRCPEVLFSPIRSRPRSVDVRPPRLVRWSHGETLEGRLIKLPEEVLVTSRWSAARPAHYALVCRSNDPIAAGNHGELSFGQLRNLLSGRPLGASQVTAVVRRARGIAADGPSYPIALRVMLDAPYFVRLRHPRDAVTGRTCGEGLPQRAV